MHCIYRVLPHPSGCAWVHPVANLSTAYFRVRDAACYIQPTFVEIKIQFTSQNIFDDHKFRGALKENPRK